MSNRKKRMLIEAQRAKKYNKVVMVVLSVVVTVLLAFIGVKAVISFQAEKAQAAQTAPVVNGGDLKILKSEVTEKVRFYPYMLGDMDMEILALKAGDGSVKVALNTCLECYQRGNGYFKQQGDSLICQACGTSMELNQFGVAQGGCNPIPVLNEDISDDGTSITIAQAYMEKKSDYFKNWSKK